MPALSTPSDRPGPAPALLAGASAMGGAAALQRTGVAFHRRGPHAGPGGHDARTKAAVSRSMAGLLGLEFVDDVGPVPSAGLYVVPSDTLTSFDEAARLGIHGPEDFFGGVVPHAFVASKVITHPLVRPDAAAPAGWSAAMGEGVRDVVLPGFSAFAAGDARRAGERLLETGAVRVKQADGVGGGGQTVVRDARQLASCIGALDPAALESAGLVLERNLTDVTTHSVGQVQIGSWLASYCGEQHTTRNHRGHEVYGGSTLTVVRGGFDALLCLNLAAAVRTAVDQALIYQRSAWHCFPGLFASRRNYDVAQGTDESGTWRSGVLEQSWRIGGASGAEVAALHAFQADPALQVVRASTHEIYADPPPPIPLGALVHFDGVDEHVGRLVKYARVEPHVDA